MSTLTKIKAKAPEVGKQTVYYAKVASILAIFAAVYVLGLPVGAVKAFITQVTLSQLAGLGSLSVGVSALLSGYLRK